MAFCQAARAFIGDRLYPVRLYFRYATRVEFGGIHELGRHHPFWPRLLERRAGRDAETDAARALVAIRLAILEADIAKQAGQQRTVHLVVARFFLVELEVHFLCD